MARRIRARRWAISWAPRSGAATSRRSPRTANRPDARTLSLETDLLIDRRRLKRRLIFWQTLAVLAVIAAVLLGLRIGGASGDGGARVERVRIDGIITDDPKLERAVRALAGDRQVKAVLLAIDSPGGSVAGGEALHDALAAVAAAKPLVAVMGGTAASAGYMIATPAARIFARRGTLTGSIGVYLQTAEIEGLLTKLGIETTVVKSGPLKDQPSLVEPLTAQGRDMLQGLIMDYYDQFVRIVAEGRHMDPARVKVLADGRPYTGQQAVANGLVDAIGSEPEARAWLASARGVPASVPTRELDQRSLAARLLSSGALGADLWQALLSQAFPRISVWSLLTG